MNNFVPPPSPSPPEAAASADRRAVFPPAGAETLVLSGGQREVCAGRSKTTSISADGRYLATFTSVSSRIGDSCAYRLSIKKVNSKNVITIRVFHRWAELVWAPSGHRFALNDGIGSNVGDCFVSSAGRASASKISLTSMIMRSPGRPASPETPSLSHFYVQCHAWSGPNIISASLFGHTDEEHSHAFCHSLVYDVRKQRISWRASTRWTEGLDHSC